MDLNLALVAGMLSTVVFIGSVLPMLFKAVRTRDLASYSLGNLLLANLGNVVHSVYVFSLPMGPIWALHSFYLLTSGFMLIMYLRHREPPQRQGPGHDVPTDVLRDEAFGNYVFADQSFGDAVFEDDVIQDDGRTPARRPGPEPLPVGISLR